MPSAILAAAAAALVAVALGYLANRRVRTAVHLAAAVGWFVAVWAYGTLLLPLNWGKRGYLNRITRQCAAGLLWLFGTRVVVHGKERVAARWPCVYLFNHQSLMDFFILGSWGPEGVVVMGKKSLGLVPFFGWVFAGTGNILLDRKNAATAREQCNTAAAHLHKDNVSLLMAPEGTRNSNALSMLPFKKGAFHVAIKAGVPLVPVVTSDLRGVCHFERGEVEGGVVHCEVLEPIDVTGYTAEQVDDLIALTRQRMEEGIARVTALANADNKKRVR
eukprot:TRINITY_DN2452_c0_g1_i2.p2 TRINITY_DN2452_c0_g1~~TRINITY_DN2452_c0_g1_i2.p2  ORF type:complete len:291 (-),score=77.82 TRINITY_DN2452_c0_g1_i2:9-833(-)